MMCSLPSLVPADPNDLWYTPLSAPTSNAATRAYGSSSHESHAHSRSNQARHHAHQLHALPTRTLLADLRHDEHALSARKGNIRRFGAGWLKPPGVPKTLQGMWDEKAEREEAELQAQREQAAAEMAAAQEEAEREARLAEMRTNGEGETEGERDLDDEIPEADEEEGDWEDDDEDEVDEEEDPAGLTQGVEGEGDYAENENDVPGLRGVDDGLGMDPDMDARDLDEDVPEAGSYEHTDTDEMDESDEDDDRGEGMSVPLPGNVRQRGAPVLGSSVFGSSPVGQSHYSRRSSGYPGRQQ